eukprot:SAG25_NODE_85_length_16527_cov_73.409240_19_plen_162_part_00
MPPKVAPASPAGGASAMAARTPTVMKKAGRSGSKGSMSPGSPAGVRQAPRLRRDSMLILDLQTKKKEVLRSILQCREELVSLDRREMVELSRSATETDERASAFDDEDSLSVRGATPTSWPSRPGATGLAGDRGRRPVGWEGGESGGWGVGSRGLVTATLL